MVFASTGIGENIIAIDGDGFPDGVVISSNIQPGLASVHLSDTEIKWIEHCIGAKTEEGILSSEISAVEIDGKRVINIQTPTFIDFKRRKELEEILQEVFQSQKAKSTEQSGGNHFHQGDYLFQILTSDTENKEQFERERRRIEDYVVEKLHKLLHESGVNPLEIRIRPTRVKGKIQRLMGEKWNLVLDILTDNMSGTVGEKIARDFIAQINSPVIDRIVSVHVHKVNPHLEAFKQEEAARKRQNINKKLAEKRKAN